MTTIAEDWTHCVKRWTGWEVKRTTHNRLAEQERRRRPPGRTLVVYLNDWREPTPDQIADDERRLADARAKLAPDDTLIIVQYVEEWRTTNGQAAG